jgi:hypothetical protein
MAFKLHFQVQNKMSGMEYIAQKGFYAAKTSRSCFLKGRGYSTGVHEIKCQEWNI